MSRSQAEYLRHILHEIDYLLRSSNNLLLEQFLADETLQRAFVRSLEIIGEATKQLSEEFRTTHKHIDWRAMAGMRDVLIHRYFGVNLHIVWDVISVELPLLQPEIQALLQTMNQEDGGDRDTH